MNTVVIEMVVKKGGYFFSTADPCWEPAAAFVHM